MGESLIDFIPDNGFKEPVYAAKAGGAPANVCAAAAKLGIPAYYIGKFSTDVFGRFLKNKMESYGVNTDYAVCCAGVSTALAFVSLNDKGEREFSFYRSQSADMLYSPEEVPQNLFAKDDILHFCSVDLCESPVKYAHKQAIKYATDAGAYISFDVNLRPSLWDDQTEMRAAVYEFLPYADLVKVTDEELDFLFEGENEAEKINSLFKAAEKAKLVFVTKGERGADAFDRNAGSLHADAVRTVVKDTTGAGDCFCSAILYRLLVGKAELSLKGMGETLRFATAACAKAVSEYGAMEAMPTLSEIAKILEK